MTKRLIYVVMALVLISGVILAGCGEKTAAPGGGEKTEILIGAINVMTGAEAMVGNEQRWAYEQGVKDINAKGGVFVKDLNKKLPMSITFTLPATVEKDLRAQFGDLDEAAKEAALVELYRQEKLSHGQLAESLGISRDEVNALLKRHNVTEDLLTIEEYDEQMEQLQKLLDK